jgi:hypothetical protein
VLVDEASESHQEIGLEGRRHEQVAARQPREQAVADQTVTEVRGEQAQGSTEGLDVEGLSQTDPARRQRPVRVHDALRIAGGARREQDERLVVEPRTRSRSADGRVGRARRLDGVHDRHPGFAQRGQNRRARGVVDERDSWPCRGSEGGHLERRQARIEWDRRPTGLPDGEQLGEELEPVAER